MVSNISIQDAFSLNWPIIDVRSPGEFDKGHIPGAINVSLFSNEERAHVGTVYKQESQEAAVRLGYTYVNPKLKSFITKSQEIAPNNTIIVHCWRGGMRSQSFAKHLSDNGFNDVRVIEGGYKAYRNYVLNSLAQPANLNVLGGYTGSGKTYILHEMQNMGQQVIDLEGLANHKGSAFGGIGQDAQPSVEQFENNLYHECKKLDLTKPIWIEDESVNIGRVKIPQMFFDQMRKAKLYFIDIPKHIRARHLVSEYACYANHDLSDAILRISKRLGGLNVKNALSALAENRYTEVAEISLYYYDKAYLNGIKNRKENQILKIALPSTNHAENASIIIKNTK